MTNKNMHSENLSETVKKHLLTIEHDDDDLDDDDLDDDDLDLDLDDDDLDLDLDDDDLSLRN